MWKQYISHFYFIILIEFISCCQCNKSDVKYDKIITNRTDLFTEKRRAKNPEFEDQDFATTDLIIENLTDMSMPDDTTSDERVFFFNDNSSDLIESNSEINENIQDSNETSLETTEPPSVTKISSTTVLQETAITRTTQKSAKTNKPKLNNRGLVKKCRHFKKGAAFDLKKMVDIWQVVYYRLPNKLKCFKMHIKLVKPKEQQHYGKIYGSFNNTVQWHKCNLEVKTSDKAESGTRRHFLQGANVEKGVMENIIIDEEHCQNATYLTLHRESADQWLVIKNLLVMRDCDTGDFVVFSRVPLEPRQDDVLDALMIFGENKPNGTLACDSSNKN